MVEISDEMVKAFRRKYREFWPGCHPDLKTCRELLEASMATVDEASNAFRASLTASLEERKAEPVAWQHRTRGRYEGAQWGAWIDGRANFTKMDHEERPLFLAPPAPDKAVEALVPSQRLEALIGTGQPTSSEAHDMAVELILHRRAALSSLGNEQGWKDIATAPKDGTPILVYAPSAGVGVDIAVWWDLRQGFDIGWYYEDEPEREEELARSFTHWMPLPAAPQTAEERR